MRSPSSPAALLPLAELLFLLLASPFAPPLALSQRHEGRSCADDAAGECAAPREAPEGGGADGERRRRPPQPRRRPPRPKGRLPDDFVDPCKDENPSCPAWAREGECANNPNYMLKSCARSCGTCNSVDGAAFGGGRGGGDEEEGDACVDEFEQCAQWEEGAECWVNPLFMQTRCKYSCWKCVSYKKDRQLGIDEEVIAKKALFANMDTGMHQLLPRINDVYNPADYEDGVNPMSEPDFQRLRSAVREMDLYARRVATGPSVPKKARERCRNEFRMCAEWASRGACLPPSGASGGTTPGSLLFMMNHCPLACRTCEELESFHRCAGRRHPGAEPSFRPGGLRPFFEGGRGPDSEWAAYEPVYASRPNAEEEGGEDDPYVVILQKFLTDEEADLLRLLNSATVGPPRGYDDGIYRRIARRVASLVNSTTSHLEPMEVVRHPPGGARPRSAYRHNFEVDGLWRPAGPRVLSLFLFLHDDGGDEEGEGGGGLGFPYLDWLRVRPRKGSAALWPNVRDGNLLEADPLTAFEHFPPQGGEEEGSVVLGSYVHVRLHNWTDASSRGCA